MSSPGRYQSRLFNLISRQSRRLSDRVALGLRQAKIAVSWSAQILLYPAYAAFQTTRLVSRQIGQVVQQALPKLQTAGSTSLTTSSTANHDERLDADQSNSSTQTLMLLQADTPILRSIAALQSFTLPVLLQPTAWLPGLTTELPTPDRQTTAITLTPGSHLAGLESRTGSAIANSNSLAIEPLAEISLISAPAQADSMQVEQSDYIRGIASLLSDRRLVLTTGQNWVLDILTIEQQTQLQQRMIWELAGYWRSQHLLRLQQQNSVLLPLASDQPHLLPPVSLLRRLMAWVQTSPVAMAANLFREADLIRVIPEAMPFQEQISPHDLRISLLSEIPVMATASLPLPEKPTLLKGSAPLPSIEELRALKQWLNQALSALTSKPTALITKPTTLTSAALSPTTDHVAAPVSISLTQAALSKRAQMLWAKIGRSQSTPSQPIQPLSPMAIAAPMADFFRNQQHWWGRALHALLVASESKPVLLEDEAIDLGVANPPVLTTQPLPARSPLSQIQLPLIRSRQSRRFDRELSRKQSILVDVQVTTALSPGVSQSLSLKSFDQVDRGNGEAISAPELIGNNAPTAVGTQIVETQAPLPIATPTWVETEATFVGYVKHPLERLLAWLDSGMLWLEKVSTKIWSWLRH